MAEALGAAGSIVGIVAFGLQFVTKIQMYIDTVENAENSFRNIALDISATASALDQINRFIEEDRATAEKGKASSGQSKNATPIISDPGQQHLAGLASQCKGMYMDTARLIAKKAGVPWDEKEEVLLNNLELGVEKASVLWKLKWPFKESQLIQHQIKLSHIKNSIFLQLYVTDLAKTKRMSVSSPEHVGRAALMLINSI